MQNGTIRTSRRRILTGSALSALLALTACGQTSAPPSPAASTAPTPASPAHATPTTAPAAAAPVSSAKPMTISYFNWFGPTDPQSVVFPYASKLFAQKYPNVKIDNQFNPTLSQLETKLETMVAGGTPPDASALNPQIITPLYSKGLLMDVSALIKQDAATWHPEDFFPATLTRVIKDGKQFAVPLQMGLFVMVVNLTLFKQAGASLPSDSWTWDKEFVEACQQVTKLTSNGTKQFGTVLPPMELPIWADGGDVLSEDGTKCLLDEPSAASALQWMSDLLFKYKVAPLQADMQGLDQLKLFMTGRLGIDIDITGSVSQIERQKPKFDWDLFIVPKGKVTRATIVQGPSLAVFQPSHNRDMAWNWVEFYTSSDIQTYAAKEAKVVSARQSAATAYLSVPPPPAHRAPLVDSVKFARQRLFLPNWSQVNDTITKNLDDVLTTDKKTAAQAAQTACQQIQPLLAKP